jgi:hypothetical protein
MINNPARFRQQRFIGEELDRLEHGPIIDGELGMTCWKGHFSMKRYVGVDLSQV